MSPRGGLGLRLNVIAEVHHRWREQALVHAFEIRRDPRSEAHVLKYIPLEIDAGRNLDQLECPVQRPKYGTL